MTSNELANLKDGTTVEVTRDIANPCVDRRTRHDWRKAEFIEKGTKLVVKHYESRGKYEPEHIEFIPVNGYLHQSLYLSARGSVIQNGWEALTALVVEHTAVAERTFASVAKAHHCGTQEFSRAVVDELLRTGKLTLDEVEALYVANHNRPEEE